MRCVAGLPVRCRLTGAFLLIMAVSATAVAVGWARVGGVAAAQHGYALTAHHAGEVAAAAYNMRISQSQNLLVPGYVKNPDGSDMHRSDISAFERALDGLGASVHDQQSRSAYAVAKARYRRWAKLDRTIQALAAAGRTAQATRLANGTENALGDALAQGMTELAAAQMSAGAASTASNMASVRLRIGLLGLAGFLLAAVLSGAATRSVVRPLRGLARASRRVAAGELGARVQGEGGGRELRSVAAAFNQMAATIERDHAGLEARRQEEEALRRVATAVAESPGASEVCTLLAGEVTRLVGGETGAVVRFSDAAAGNVVGSWAAPGAVRMDVGTAVPLVGDGANAQVARTGQTARVESYASAGPDLVRLVEGHGYHGGIAAPVRAGGRLWGALWVATTRAEPLPAQAEERLGRFSELVGLAVSSADAWERLESLASTDPLTGLPNRRVFRDRLEIEVERARRHGRPLSVVILDIDHFKLVNDTHGHETGDHVLSEVARRLRGVVRGGEVIARVGGEEFAWLLPEADGMAAFAAAERARRAIGEAPFDEVGALTISAGVCDMEQAGSGDELLRLADTALYWAKAHGRNATYRHVRKAPELLPADT